MIDLSTIGDDYIRDRLMDLTTEIIPASPVEFSEDKRYLPPSVTDYPGYINFDMTPHLIEPLESMDVRDPCREGTFMKGHQIGASTILESIIFYFAAHIKTVPCMYVTADGGLSSARIEHNFLPMFRQSGMDIFRSADTGNSRKKGVTKEFMQWIGGGYLVPFGAKNADKMRQFSIAVLIMDEVGAWVDVKDGDPVELLKNRTSGFRSKKIMIVSTPTLEGSCKCYKQFLRGDQRVYKNRCLRCGYPQDLRLEGQNKQTGKRYGMDWDYDEKGKLDEGSVRYLCKNCGHPHMENDKVRFIRTDRSFEPGEHDPDVTYRQQQSFWEPTATPAGPNIRSWHAPTMISKIQPWYQLVYTWLDAFDKKTRKVRDVQKLRVLYNNGLGWPFRDSGDRVSLRAASAHRRLYYHKGEIPNEQIGKYCDTSVMFLTCTVDVQKAFLSVAIWGWAVGVEYGYNPWLIDYFRIDEESEEGCASIDAAAWGKLQEIKDTGQWTSDDGKKYPIWMMLVDARWGESTATVVEFCKQWEHWVYPIMGTPRPPKSSKIIEFREAKTRSGDFYYEITVDHYKDRIAPALRRVWREEEGAQPPYLLNLPVDISSDEIKELTKEYKAEKVWPDGTVTTSWHRPNGAHNELWDLLVYGHASVEILAWMVCVKHYKLETVDWYQFWEYCKTGVFWQEAD
jgi:phage terminase large subunit GpA-like protein